MKKFLSIALIFTLVFSTFAFVPSTSSQAATKQILIARLNGNTLTCHKSTFNTQFKRKQRLAMGKYRRLRKETLLQSFTKMQILYFKCGQRHTQQSKPQYF